MLNEKKSKQLFLKIVSLRSEIDTSHALYSFSYVESELVCHKIIDGTDVYDMLNSVRKQNLVQQGQSIVLYTEGWASPTDANGKDQHIPPSQHPNRKRVKLLCILNHDSTIVESVISLDEKEDLKYDSSGKGLLADSLKKIFNTLKENYDEHDNKSFYI